MSSYLKLAIGIIIFAFISIISVFYYCYNECYTESMNKVENFYINENKKQTKSDIEALIYRIEKARNRFRNSIKLKLKQHTYKAYSLAYDIYNKHKNTLTQKEIKQLILNSLYNMDCSHKKHTQQIFIIDLNTKKLFQKNAKQSTDREKLIKQSINNALTQKQKEFFKEKTYNNKHFAIYAKLFEPFNWCIFSIEPLDKYNNTIKNSIIDELYNYRYGFKKHGYYFVIQITDLNNPQCFGYEIVDPNTPQLVGKCLSINKKDATGFLYRKKYINDIKSKGYSIARYHYKIPNTNKTGEKFTYLKLYKPFNWIIGTGIYEEDIGQLMLNLRQNVKRWLIVSSINYTIIIAITFAIMYFIIYLLFKKIHKEINLLSDYIFKFPNSGIDINKLTVTHIKNLANNIKKSLEERNEFYQKFVEAKQRHQKIVDNMPSCLIVVQYKDKRCVITTVNHSSVMFFQTNKDNLIGKQLSDLFPDNSILIKDVEYVIKNNIPIISKTTTYKEKYIEYSIYALNKQEFAIILKDKTNEHLLNQELKDSEEKFRTFVENIETCIMLLTKDCKIEYYNNASKIIINSLPIERNGIKLLDLADEKYIKIIKDTFTKTLLSKNTTYRMDVELKNKRWIAMSFSKLHIKKKPHVLISCIDVTDIYKSKQKLEYLSFHDPLTGAYNRRFFNEELNRLFNSRNNPFALVVMDMDGLKIINDVLGHPAGDKALKRFVSVYKTILRQNDIFARIGGDEFAIIAPNTDKDGIERILKRANDEFKKIEQEENLYISFSYGYAINNGEFKSCKDMFTEADRMLYEQKSSKSRKEKLKKILEKSLNNKKNIISKDLS